MTTRHLLAILAFAISISALQSKDGFTGKLPAMGWSSWNEYGCDINETVFIEVAQSLKALGLKDRGYQYVNIDDCWSDKINMRDTNTNELLPDYEKFPQGINHTAEKIHDLGFKIGIYGDAGTLTCGGFAGSLGYEEIDATTWAKWGIDYLKYDNCNVPLKSNWTDAYKYFPELWRGGPPFENQTEGDPSYTSGIPAPPSYDWSTSTTAYRYQRMRDALLNQERSIEFSLCAWGHQHVEQWLNQTGHSRMWGDIYPIWEGSYQWSWGLMPIVNHASFFSNWTDFWSHGDWDMLEVGNGNLTLEENRSHFALWAAFKSPLIIGTPLVNIKPEILAILENEELIEFNQDLIYGGAALPYKWGINPDFTWNQTHPAEFYVGPSTKGLHVFVLNTLDSEVEKKVVFSEIPGLDNDKYLVHDMWTGKDLGIFEKEVSLEIKGHDTSALRITEITGQHPCPKWIRPKKWWEASTQAIPGEKPSWW